MSIDHLDFTPSEKFAFYENQFIPQRIAKQTHSKAKEICSNQEYGLLHLDDLYDVDIAMERLDHRTPNELLVMDATVIYNNNTASVEIDRGRFNEDATIMCPLERIVLQLSEHEGQFNAQKLVQEIISGKLHETTTSMMTPDEFSLMNNIIDTVGDQREENINTPGLL